MKLIDLIKAMRVQLRGRPDVAVRYDLLTLVVGECERVSKEADDLAVLSILRKLQSANAECLNLVASDKLTEENNFLNTLLEKYTPKQMTADGIIFRINQNGIKTLAEAMKYLKTNWAGQYDGKMASEVVKQHFAK